MNWKPDWIYFHCNMSPMLLLFLCFAFMKMQIFLFRKSFGACKTLLKTWLNAFCLTPPMLLVLLLRFAPENKIILHEMTALHFTQAHFLFWRKKRLYGKSIVNNNNCTLYHCIDNNKRILFTIESILSLKMEPHWIQNLIKMTGGTLEVRSNKSLTLLAP